MGGKGLEEGMGGHGSLGGVQWEVVWVESESHYLLVRGKRPGEDEGEKGRKAVGGRGKRGKKRLDSSVNTISSVIYEE